MKNLIGISVLIFISYWIWSTIISPPKWIGWYYPDASNLLNYKQSPELDSLEQCREWVDQISGGRTDTGFDYECGKNCEISDDYKYLQENSPDKLVEYNLKPTYVCNETVE